MEKNSEFDSKFLKKIACAFKDYSKEIHTTPFTKRIVERVSISYTKDDLSLSDRISLLLEWWEASGEEHFLEKALSMLSIRERMAFSWLNNHPFPKLYQCVSVFDDNVPQKQALLKGIESYILDSISKFSTPGLFYITRDIQKFIPEIVPDSITNALDEAIECEFSSTNTMIEHLDTEDELIGHMGYLDSLADFTQRDPEPARKIVMDRISQLEEPDVEEKELDFPPSKQDPDEDFDDAALHSLFANLLRK